MAQTEMRKTLAENLVKYRRLNGLTQAQLAECVGYSDKSVSKWERGEGVPDIFVLQQISRLYGISIAELVGEQKESKETAALRKAQEKNRKARENARKKVLEHSARAKRKKD